MDAPARKLAAHLWRRISPAKTEEANLKEIEDAFQALLDQWEGRLDRVREMGEKAVEAEKAKHRQTFQELLDLQAARRDRKV